MSLGRAGSNPASSGYVLINSIRFLKSEIFNLPMRNEKEKKLFVGLIVLLFIVQISTLIYFILEINELNEAISKNELIMSQNFNSVNQDIDSINLGLVSVNSEINTISNSLSSTQRTLSETQSNLLETQMNLEEQISSIKAKTSSDFSGMIEDSIKAVVSIKTNAAQGTGFIIANDGYVVTNAHVLEGARYANAITAEQEIKPMDLIGYSPTLDLALLKISGSYEELQFADSDDVRVGEKVIAIGNPFGLSFSVSEGIISATGRTVSGYNGRYIQTDAALNSGNSGGPLINTDGKVIGINNFKIEGDNIGFALESNYIIEEVNRIALENIGADII